VQGRNPERDFLPSSLQAFPTTPGGGGAPPRAAPPAGAARPTGAAGARRGRDG